MGRMVRESLRNEKICSLEGKGLSTNSKLPRIFIKPVTTDKRDYRISRNFFAEKIFPGLGASSTKSSSK